MKKIVLSMAVAVITSGLLAQADLQVGNVHPEAKWIDFDTNAPYKEGFAVLKKGTAYALIDAGGNFVVPYGTYKEIPNGFSNGLCLVRCSSGKFGYVDASGKEIIPCAYQSASSFSKLGYAIVIQEQQLFLLNKQGQQQKFDATGYVSGLFSPQFEQGSYYIANGGIRDTYGRLVTPIDYLTFFDDRFWKNNSFHQFSEGLAAISKEDEFGQKKWGYIDTSGKTVIPFQFSQEPHDFSNGLAVVYPAPGTSDFINAYIDKSGNVKIKVMRQPDKNINIGGGDFSPNGYAFLGNNIHLIDKEGEISSIEELLNYNEKINIGTERVLIISLRDDDVLFRTWSSSYNHSAKLGLMSTSGHLKLPPVFEKLDHFDPYSRLATASFYDASERKSIIGYIDENGVFVIVPKEKSQW